jgi:monofunctional biosynthetic peptidoglycan transglycosylase
MVMDGNGITKDWTSLSNIDRSMVRAVIAAEDGKFCSHDGFDRQAIEKAIESNAQGGRIRGVRRSSSTRSAGATNGSP